MKTIAFFNNKGGVGKTSLVYHLAYMFAERGIPVVAVDLDPQANLSAMFLDEERAEALSSGSQNQTIYSSLQPLLEGTGDVKPAPIEKITPGLDLVVGDLSLARAEDELSSQWPQCMAGNPRAFRVVSSFWRTIESAGQQAEAQLALIDVGPNLGAINRAALIAAEHVVIPLAPDLYSLQALTNLGPTLCSWRKEWQDRLERAPTLDFSLPQGKIQPLGYVILQHGVRASRPVKAYDRWIDKIPSTFREEILHEAVSGMVPSAGNDPYCLALLKHYRSLMPLAMEVHKPMFHLKPAEGAIGAHVAAVLDCYQDFLVLARKIAEAVGIPFP